MIIIIDSFFCSLITTGEINRNIDLLFESNEKTVVLIYYTAHKNYTKTKIIFLFEITEMTFDEYCWRKNIAIILISELWKDGLIPTT
jgi:hypothetical protein